MCLNCVTMKQILLLHIELLATSMADSVILVT